MVGRYKWTTERFTERVQFTGVDSVTGRSFVTGNGGVLAGWNGRGRPTGLFTTGARGNGHWVKDVAITDDGERVWFSGASGTFGYYDRATGAPRSHSSPYGITSNFRSLAVRGDSGQESVHTVDGSGRVVRARLDGERMRVEGVSIPGNGTGFTDIVDDGETLYAADSGGSLYRSTDGRHWSRRRLTQTTIVGLGLGESGLAAVDDSGTLYGNVSLFGEPGSMHTVGATVSSPMTVASHEDTTVVAGGGGAIAVVDGQGRVSTEDCGLDKSFSDSDIRPDGTLVTVGSDGSLAAGRPV